MLKRVVFKHFPQGFQHALKKFRITKSNIFILCGVICRLLPAIFCIKAIILTNNLYKDREGVVAND